MNFYEKMLKEKQEKEGSYKGADKKSTKEEKAKKLQRPSKNLKIRRPL